MRKIMTAAALTAAAVLSACATATPYQPAQMTAAGPRNGFYEAPIEQNRWRVGFNGNTVTSRQQVEDALLLRAAELTLQQGFEHFTAVNRATDRDVRYSASPGLGASSAFGYSRFGYGPFGYSPFGYSRFGFSRFGGYPYWSPYWSAFGPYRRFGGFGYDPFWDDIDVREIDRYEATAEIVMGRGPRPNDPATFDAREIVANLGSRIARPMQPGSAPRPVRRY
ncbi:MAG: hypothetical protein M3M95_02875 [Pseudomonadota bacterium]|nr:hypothetical protein [Pseudomonadota bacterium]